MRKFSPEDIVYVSYSPQSVGIVMSVVVADDFPDINSTVRVMWCRRGNPQEDVRVVRLRHLKELIDSTKDKLDGHIRRYARAHWDVIRVRQILAGDD